MFSIEKQAGIGIHGWPYLIDKENNIIIRAIESPGYPDGESLYKFELLMNESRLVFAGSKSEKRVSRDNNSAREYDISWVLRDFIIPKEMRASRETIKAIITEALKTWGQGFNQEQARKFRIQFTDNKIGWYIPNEHVKYWDK